MTAEEFKNQLIFTLRTRAAKLQESSEEVIGDISPAIRMEREAAQLLALVEEIENFIPTTAN